MLMRNCLLAMMILMLRDTRIAFYCEIYKYVFWYMIVCLLIPYLIYIVHLWFLNTTYMQSNKNQGAMSCYGWYTCTSYRNMVQGLRCSTWWRPQNLIICQYEININMKHILTSKVLFTDLPLFFSVFILVILLVYTYTYLWIIYIYIY